MTNEKSIGPLVSVVMSTYLEVNAPAPVGEEGSMLSRAINSVRAQSYSNWELWVVSDHPPEPDREAIEKLIASFGDERIHYEDLETRAGLGTLGVKPKRRGVERSGGTLLAFLDADNAFEREHLSSCVQVFSESGHTLDLVYCDTRVIFGGKPDEEDFGQQVITFLYRLVGREVLEKELYPLSVLGRMAGESFTWEKPVWGPAAAKKLASFNFIDVSDAVMTRTAYDAASGLQDLPYLSDWQLWLDMIRAGHDRFRRVPRVGLRYTTESLVHHRRHYGLSILDRLNLPVDMAKLHAQIKGEIGNQLKVKHDGGPRVSVQNRRPRILFLGEAAAISHVVRPAMLAAHLHRQNYDVSLACDPRYNQLISENGFKRVDLDSLPMSVILERLRRNEPVYDVDTLDRYVQQDLKLLREFKPDVVVGDQRHSLSVSSQLTGVPYVNIADGQWSSATDPQYEIVDSPVSQILGRPLANMLFQVIRPVAFAFQTMPLNAIRARYGLPGLGSEVSTVFTYGDYTVYPNDPELFPLKHQLPARHTFIGPLIWSPDVAKPGWWDRLPDTRPIIYVSLGSTGQPNLLETVFRVLGELPVTVIAATAARKKMGNLPANIFIADFLPGTEAARRSRFVICNGGAMSGQQALSAGVPYLGLVSNMDQLLFSKAVRKAGACEFICEGEVNERALRPLIANLLSEPSYQAAAKTRAASTSKWESCGEFERVIRSVMNDRIK